MQQERSPTRFKRLVNSICHEIPDDVYTMGADEADLLGNLKQMLAKSVVESGGRDGQERSPEETAAMLLTGKLLGGFEEFLALANFAHD